MITISWEINLDLEIGIPSLHHVSIGTNKDATIGFAEVSEPSDIVGFDHANNECLRITDWSVIDTDGLCKVTGTIRNPWGKAKAIRRIDLMSDNLSASTSIYTNSKGEFYFPALPGERMKVKFPDEHNCYWIAIPDKNKLTWDEIKDYGYELDGWA